MGDQRAAWAVTIGLSLAMLMVPAGFLLLLSAQGGEASDSSEPVRTESLRRSHTDREARVTFHLRPGSLGMRILRDAPPDTTVVRGREVRVLCGSVSGLKVHEARWPRGRMTLTIDLPEGAWSAIEFCALKRGTRGVARVVFP